MDAEHEYAFAGAEHDRWSRRPVGDRHADVQDTQLLPRKRTLSPKPNPTGDTSLRRQNAWWVCFDDDSLASFISYHDMNMNLPRGRPCRQTTGDEHGEGRVIAMGQCVPAAASVPGVRVRGWVMGDSMTRGVTPADGGDGMALMSCICIMHVHDAAAVCSIPLVEPPSLDA